MEEEKKKPRLNKQIMALIETSIPIRRAVFHDTVTSSTGEPEFAFYDQEKIDGKPAAKPSRLAKLYYTPIGLIVDQKGKIKLIPLANVKDSDVL